MHILVQCYVVLNSRSNLMHVSVTTQMLFLIYPCRHFIFITQGIAITQENSLLDNTARIEGWLARFPMFDWVGGRTSEMSAVGLLPAALQVGFGFIFITLMVNWLSETQISYRCYECYLCFRESTLEKCLLVQN